MERCGAVSVPRRVPSGTDVGQGIQLDELTTVARTQEAGEPEMLALANQVEKPRLGFLRDVVSDSSAIGRWSAAKLGPNTGQPIEQGLHYEFPFFALSIGSPSGGLASLRPTNFASASSTS